ncbi:MAG TPA: arginine--tRNA ligase [Longimicrobiales bacterium]|nr:arginine--tRNA ligase [Longimicrobiales bacterium]
MAEGQLRAQLEHAAAQLGAEAAAVELMRPRNPEHGDVATNLAMILARPLGQPPRDIAGRILELLDLAAAGVASADIAGPGFINFRFRSQLFRDRLAGIVSAGEAYGASENASPDNRIMVEWVSANPTGPLHLGHGRQAALGDAISRLLARTGWDVHREFYYNDSGKQMDLLARSVWARYQQAAGRDAAVPEGGYHGEYVQDIAGQFRARQGDRFVDDDSADALEAMRRFAVEALRAEQDHDLAEFRVRFDEYYLESSLYDTGRVDGTIQALRDTGLVYDKDGALWLETTRFGDQKDRVMVRRNGMPTYFLPDVAYHMTKWERGFHHVINVQGSDHHGTVPRVRAGLQALGLPEGYPEYVLHQMVRLERAGKEVKFSKRAGAYTTLRELFEMVGVDVARYFFLMRRADAQMVFDLDLALDRSEKNPVFKVQYAHARMCSIFRKAGLAPERGMPGAEVDAVAGAADLDRLTDDAEQELIKQLALFPETVQRAAEARAPHVLCEYLETTAGQVNSWYHAGNPSRNPELAVLVEDEALRNARVALARGVQVVLRNGLDLLGLGAPERMQREEETE